MICCGKQRTGNFCGNCGKPLSFGLSSLLAHCESNHSAICQRIETLKGQSEVLTKPEAKRHCLRIASALGRSELKWRKWSEDLKAILQKESDAD